MERTLLNLTDQTTKLRLLSHVGALRGSYWVEIRKFRRGRTLRQNAWYWSCTVAGVGEFLREQGEQYTDEDAHEMLKWKFLRESVVNKKTGEIIGERVRSTATLNIEEMVNYCEDCRNWLAEFGIIVPDPEPIGAIP